MGSEHSLHRNRNCPYGETMPLRVKNNLHTLQFHAVHGENVRLSKNNTVACRSEGFCKGIVFSNRPVTVCEPIYIKFLEISANWSGALRIGFTSNDPVNLKSKLPRYACPDLTATPGNWAKAIADRLAKKDSVLFYYVDANGDVHYGIDTEEFGVFFGGVRTSGKLWAVLDIYGNTTSIEFINPNLLKPELHHDQNEIIRNLGSFILDGTGDQVKLNVLAFHRMHGQNVTLKNNGFVLSRKPAFQKLCYAFTERALVLGEKLVVQIQQTNVLYQGTLIYGVTTCDPSTITPLELPENANDLLDRSEYWVFTTETNAYNAGDFMICSITTSGEVQVAKNKNPMRTVLHVDPTQSFWFFFDLNGSISDLWLVGTVNGSVSNLCKNSRLLDSLKVALPPSNPNSTGEQAGPSGQSATLNSIECVICCEKPVDCALYRCGHMCLCHDCAMKFWKPDLNVQCPICRKRIEDVIKIYR